MVVVTIGVLALQGDVSNHQRAVEAAGAYSVPVRSVSQIEAVDGIVIPGGESTAMSYLADVVGVRSVLEQRIKEGTPVYGSCAGMIMLANTILDGRSDQVPFGGLEITVRRNAFGRQIDSFEEDLTVEGVSAQPLRAVFIRAPFVEKVGQSVRILARTSVHASTTGADRIVAVQQGALLATAFHPELTGDTRMHEYFVQMVRENVETKY